MALPAGFRAIPLPLAQLSLDTVLACGQSFRWFKHALPGATAAPHEYRFALHDRVVCLRQTPESLLWRSEPPSEDTPDWLRDYFQLDVDLAKLYTEWSAKDNVFDTLVKDRFPGLRMLRQDPWENLLSFICSQNNHISRISKMVQALCTNFGHRVVSLPVPDSDSGEVQDYFSFPKPSALAAPTTSAKLRALGFGYRAEYIQRTAQMLLDEASGSDEEVYKRLLALRSASTDDAREALLKLMGVGRKVADCILLMSLDKREVVPVDTHVVQIAVKHYKFRPPGSPAKAKSNGTGKITMTPKIYDAITTNFVDLWGEWAGWAQTVLFTADLKSFASYGLVTPSPSVSPSKADSEVTLLGTPESTPSQSPKKRKRIDPSPLLVIDAEDIASRVKAKKRSRTLSGASVESTRNS